MKRILVAGLSVLMLSGLIAPSANAQTQIEQKTAITQETATRSATTRLSPNTLVTLAYRGAFRDQGISVTGRVNAESLVKAAIEAGRLSPEVLEDERYLNIVDTFLMGLKG
ncbi:MAG: hypothetical protein MUD14_21190 [Hydrococcus sp. Prado102]|jgi:hypothetical protein|nr:hypothetical protein [Hydrococcus sp. Prado102]